MNKKLKIVILSVVSVLAVGVVAGACWWFMRPQKIILGDGGELTLLDVTYGKRHKLAKSKVGGRALRGGSITTSNDSLCVWIEQKHDDNNWPNYQVLAYDSANTACVAESTRTWANFGNKQNDQVVGFVFSAFPRHSGRIHIHILEWGNGGQYDNDNHFSFSNPAKLGTVAKWIPEKLPITQQDGDLQVTLTRMESDSSTFGQNGGDAKPDDPMKNAVRTAYRIEQGGVLVTNWQPVQVDTSDATGNTSRNRSTHTHQDKDEEVMVYQYGLWPDEPAWKMRVELSRNSGFAADEMWTVSSLPLTNGNMNQIWNNNRKEKPFAETTLGETHVQIYPVMKLSDQDSQSYGGMEGIFRVNIKPQLEGARMTIISVTDDKNKAIDFSSWGGGGSDFRYQLKDLGKATNLNITLAVHRSRYVEYTVKPVQK